MEWQRNTTDVRQHVVIVVVVVFVVVVVVVFVVVVVVVLSLRHDADDGEVPAVGLRHMHSVPADYCCYCCLCLLQIDNTSNK